jgi:hypothetical protein
MQRRFILSARYSKPPTFFSRSEVAKNRRQCLAPKGLGNWYESLDRGGAMARILARSYFH